jgi:hypothetical protein
VIWDFAGDSIPDALLADMERLCEETDNPNSRFRVAREKLLADYEVNAFHARLRHLLRIKIFPKPGRSGPNYPWPPV